jgi:hypothetical protein
LNKIRLARIDLNLFSQREDVSIHGAVIVDGIGPGLAEQFRTAEGQSARLRQHIEQGIL